MLNVINEIYPYYCDIRHKIHSYPELHYEEFKTAALVAEELQKLNLPVQTQVGQTGVVAILDSGKPGKTLAFRADMDALPITEDTQLPYQSKTLGKMHACGHDGHTATLLAVAKTLSLLKDQFTGKVKFIFQPAEEGGAGAKAMIDDGVLDNPKVDAIFAYHNHPGTKLGTVLARSGCTLYGNTDFMLKIHGKGGHAAQPERVNNPIIVASDIVLQFQQILLTLSKEPDPTVVSITQCNSGFATNVIPDAATLIGTIRTASDTKLNYVKELMVNSIKTIEQQYHAQIELIFKDLYSPTINTKFETEFLLNETRSILTQNQVLLKPHPSRAAEDFSFFLKEVPGCYFFIGNGEESASCHNSKYDFNDEVIKIGAKVLCNLAIRYLS